MELSYIYMHIFIAQQASYLKTAQNLALEQVPQLSKILLREMEDKACQVDPIWNDKTQRLYSIVMSDKSETLSHDGQCLSWRVYKNNSQRLHHIVDTTKIVDVIPEVTLFPPHRYLNFQSFVEAEIVKRTSAGSFQTFSLHFNSKKLKRNEIYLAFTDIFNVTIHALTHFYLNASESKTFKSIFEIYLRIFVTVVGHIGHMYFNTKRILTDYMNEDQSNENCRQAVFMLVFSMILLCPTVLFNASLKKDHLIHQNMSKNKSSYITKGDGLNHVFPSFLFEVRIFQHKTLNILPYRGINGIDMSNYLHRLGSFKDKDKNFKLRPYQLASDGFYSSDNPGQTKCYSCGFEYSSWQTGDDPRMIHFQNSPNCPFIRNHIELLNSRKNTSVDKHPPKDQTLDKNKKGRGCDKQQSNHSEDRKKTEEETNMDNELVSSLKDNGLKEGNAKSSIQGSHSPPSNYTIYSVPSVDQYPSDIVHIPRPQGADGHMVEKRANVSNRRIRRYHYSDYNQRNDRPRFPRYAVLTVRISSFQGFPCYLDQSPRQLALAGFFYLGYGDGVQCYFCGGKLTNWEPGDDPFVEHAKWFPMCLFLCGTKGQDFISLVEHTYRDEMLQLEDSQEIEKQSTDHDEKDLEILYDKCADRNNIHQHDPSGENGRGSSSLVIPFSIGYPILKSTKHPQSFTPSICAVSSSVSGKPSHATFTSASNHTDHSMSSLVSQMVHISVNENSQEKTAMTSESDSGSLMEENRRLGDKRLCKVCLDQESSIAFLPCGHLFCCQQCAPVIRKCPICRQIVKGSIKSWVG